MTRHVYTLDDDFPDEADPEQYGRREDAAEAARCGEPWPPWAYTSDEHRAVPDPALVPTEAGPVDAGEGVDGPAEVRVTLPVPHRDRCSGCGYAIGSTPGCRVCRVYRDPMDDGD